MSYETIWTREKKKTFWEILLVPTKEKNIIKEKAIKLKKYVSDYAIINSVSVVNDSNNSIPGFSFNDDLITEEQQEKNYETNTSHELNLFVKHWWEYKQNCMKLYPMELSTSEN